MRRRDLLVLAPAFLALPWLGAAQAEAKPVWKKEFEEICAKTQDAMALSAEDLRALVERCDVLALAIDGLEASERKVYAKRLRACRDLYAYVLESRQPRAP